MQTANLQHTSPHHFFKPAAEAAKCGIPQDATALSINKLESFLDALMSDAVEHDDHFQMSHSTITGLLSAALAEVATLHYLHQVATLTRDL